MATNRHPPAPFTINRHEICTRSCPRRRPPRPPCDTRCFFNSRCRATRGPQCTYETVPLCRLCPATFVRPWRLAYGVCISGMNTHSGLAAGHRCLHEKATSSAKSLIAPTPPPGPVSGLQLCLARLIFRYLGSRAVSPNDTTMADLCRPRMALPVFSSRTSWSEKWTHLGGRFRTQNGSVFQPRN